MKVSWKSHVDSCFWMVALFFYKAAVSRGSQQPNMAGIEESDNTYSLCFEIGVFIYVVHRASWGVAHDFLLTYVRLLVVDWLESMTVYNQLKFGRAWMIWDWELAFAQACSMAASLATYLFLMYKLVYAYLWKKTVPSNLLQIDKSIMYFPPSTWDYFH